MAAVRSMMAVAREEAAIVSTEIAMTARTSVVETARTVELELNPIAVRQAVKTSVKEGAAGESLLTSHLAHAPPIPNTTSLSATLPETLPSTAFIETNSIIAQHIEKEAGSTFKEVFTNAGQTGIEEQMDTIGDVAKALLNQQGAIKV